MKKNQSARADRKDVYLHEWEEVLGRYRRTETKEHEVTIILSFDHDFDARISFPLNSPEHEILRRELDEKVVGQKISILRTDSRERPILIRKIRTFAESDIKLEFGGANIPVERVAEYYHIGSILPKREGKMKLEIKVRGTTIFDKSYSVQHPIVERTSIPKFLEEILEDKSVSDSFLVYEKNVDKFIGCDEEISKYLQGINEHYGLKGIVLHPLFAWNEDCKDFLFSSIYKLNKRGKQLRVGFISQPTLYGGTILSEKNAEKVDFIPLVQAKCEKCGKRRIVLVRDENKLEVSCTDCETVNPEKDILRIINLPEIFRCPECEKSWLLPCFSRVSSNSKIVLICPLCSTEIGYCYFTLEEFERSLPDILVLSDRQTEWLRNTCTYLLEQKTLLCKSCGRTQPLCQLFQVVDYEKVLDEIRYNWKTIRQDILGLIEEKKKLRRRNSKLRKIRLLRRIKESEDIRVIQLLKRTSLDEKIDTHRLIELLDVEQKILKKCEELEAQLKHVSASFLRRLIHLLMKTLGFDKRESEIESLKQELKNINSQKQEWFKKTREIADERIEALKKELKELPRTRYKSIETLDHELQLKIKSLTTQEQRKLIEILKKLAVITEDYRLRKDKLNNLVIESKCFYCDGEVQSLPPLSFLFIACHDSVLVSDDLLPFTVRKDRFVNDLYLYKPLLESWSQPAI